MLYDVIVTFDDGIETLLLIPASSETEAKYIALNKPDVAQAEVIREIN